MALRCLLRARAPIAVLALLFLAACSDDTRTITVTPTPTTQPTATAIPASPTATATEEATEEPTAEPTNEPTEGPDTPAPTATFTMRPPTSTPTALPTGSATATLTPTPELPPTATSTPAPGEIQLRGSIEQVYLTDAIPGTSLSLIGPGGPLPGVADAQGSFVWDGLQAGDEYSVEVPVLGGATASGGTVTYGPVTVLSMTEHPDPSTFEGQDIGGGYGYLRTRDGTLLAINVVFPGGGGPEDGPYPTLIEYSGYDPANPDGSQPGILVGPLMGFAVVGVNMRGTGCSGGAFEYFEPAQSTDGYDIIEVIARQPWVKGGKVGMIGISYPGISQLFTAQLQPPSLAAIAPLSVISDTPYTLYPGGILNNGFAVDWAADRQRDATIGGQGWSRRRMEEGDEICIANQKLKEQAPDIFQQIEDNPFYTDEVAAPLSPVTFVDQINVPVFLAGAWQDEQTGGYFPTMLDRFTGTDNVHFTMTNGGHTDSLGPKIFGRWFEFFSLYVADEVPEFPPGAAIAIAVVGESIFDVPDLTVDPDRFVGMTLEQARAAFEADPQVRLLLDNGAGDPVYPGSPQPGFELNYDAWPIPEVEPAVWYFDADGRMSEDIPTDNGEVSYGYNPDLSQRTNLDGGSSAAWRAQPDWHWDLLPSEDEVVFTSDPLANDLVLAGSASVDLWFKSTTDDTDIQVTLSEIRPDGYETYIQNGWLRASRRVLDEALSTDLRPVPTHREEDEVLLPPGEFVSVRVELFPFAHAFREGSSVRIAIGSPGESRVLWKFDVLAEDGEVTNTVGFGEMYPSRIVLPELPGVDIPTDYPPPNALRAQPSRSIDVTQ